MASIEIRALTAADWAIWRDVRLRALADAPDAFGSKLADWEGDNDREHRWRERFDNVAFNAAALIDGHVVGVVGAMCGSVDQGRVGGADAVELISMWVDPAVRGTGVGEALVGAVLEWAAPSATAGATGSVTVTLAVRRTNLHAQRLYRRMGFALSGPNPVDDTEHLMVQVLSAGGRATS